ncbi:MAG: GGDEF domain-containing protein [Aquificaceae bacterium]|nr:GGDEF domain-containing protein [Aquificaceae bacterium]MCX7989610.1 GGDEF domain-containing protein [Aquificaceae bacterium]
MEITEVQEKELRSYIPSVTIDEDYNLLTLNDSARRMFGDVVGKKCYKVLYAFNEPCYHMGIKCPVYDKITDVDIISVSYENYIRGYGSAPTQGIYWENVINITSIQVLRLSMIDPLSGLYNRRFAESFLEKNFSLWKRYGQPFGLMFIDIDNFKEINDKQGHLTGDRVIRKISSYLKVMLRSSDVACRYGGDEFLIILPNTALEGCERVALRVFSYVECLEFSFPLSVSIGLTHPLEQDERYEDVIERADIAMYKAKKSGRGKIGVAASKERVYLIDGGKKDEQCKNTS